MNARVLLFICCFYCTRVLLAFDHTLHLKKNADPQPAVQPGYTDLAVDPETGEICL